MSRSEPGQMDTALIPDDDTGVPIFHTPDLLLLYYTKEIFHLLTP